MALGERLLLNSAECTNSPLPSMTDRIVGVLLALLAQGYFGWELPPRVSAATGASEDEVQRVLDLFDGRDPSKHLWTSNRDYWLLSSFPTVSGAMMNASPG